jgi:hypothetical protein
MLALRFGSVISSEEETEEERGNERNSRVLGEVISQAFF